MDSTSSSSLWGCELKNCRWAFWFARKSHPPCEDVSWKNKEHPAAVYCDSHPPCEDVSWKFLAVGISPVASMSSSLWGCELKIQYVYHALFFVLSSSLWGCELKNFSTFLSVIATAVILLVRMWVENLIPWIRKNCSWPSSSLWGCELKSFNEACSYVRISHPPCEDVSWKITTGLDGHSHPGHPPCEDVSWKIILSTAFLTACVVILLVRMWVEKYRASNLASSISVILLVRMWVENPLGWKL